MAVGRGMRGKDLKAFLDVARRFQVIILVRHTSEDALQYVGKSGYRPKPAIIKAKTAKMNPPGSFVSGPGATQRIQTKTSGLVAHPRLVPRAYGDGSYTKACKYWDATMEILKPDMAGRTISFRDRKSWKAWGNTHTARGTSWRWRVDIDPASPHFGCLMLKKKGEKRYCYVHGDYDLKDVIVKGHESQNKRNMGQRDSVPNFTPKLGGNVAWTWVRNALNQAVGVDMVQHGAEAQFAWHGDEPITVLYPDKDQYRHECLSGAREVQAWYEALDRKVLAAAGRDYLRSPDWVWLVNPDGTAQRTKVLPEGVPV